MRIDKGYWGNWITEGWPIEEVKISDRDRGILQDMAKQFRELCERPVEKEKIQLWKDHNDLKETRPLLLVDMENGWNEAVRFDRDIKCEGYMAQDWEMWFRKEIFWAKKLQDDKPLTPVFYLPHRAVNTEWGIGENKVEIGEGDKNKAYSWVATMKDMDDEEFENLDVEKTIEDPVVIVDEKATNAALELAKEVFDGIVDVKLRTWWFWSSHIALAYANFRGQDGLLYDNTDNTLPDMNEDVIRTELRRMFEKTKENDNHVEVVLKDLHTISNKPEQVIRWVQIAREEMERIYLA